MQLLILVSIIDLFYKLVPKELSACLIVLAFIWALASQNLLKRISLGILLVLLYFVVEKVHKNTIGKGDIKIFLALCLYFDFPYSILAIYTSFLLGAIYIFIKFLLTSHMEKRELAFVPFITGDSL